MIKNSMVLTYSKTKIESSVWNFGQISNKQLNLVLNMQNIQEKKILI